MQNQYYQQAYPTYAYPPPPPPPRYQSQNLYRYFIIGALSVILIFGITILITWLVIRPRVPDFTLTTFSVSNLTLSLPSQRLSADFNISLHVNNPNKKLSIHYEHVDTEVHYGSYALGLTWLAPFVQSTKSSTDIGGTISIVDTYVNDKVARGISYEKAGRIVGFKVLFSARAWYKAPLWWPRGRMILAVCKAPVRLDNSGSGMLVEGHKVCNVYM